MTDSFQTLFNVAIILIGALGGWVLNSITKSIQHLQDADANLTEKVQSVEILVAGQYVKRDDLNELSKALFNKLDRIEIKIDGKADK